MHFPENLPEESSIIQGLTDDIINIIEENMDAMSINLENTEGEEA